MGEGGGECRFEGGLGDARFAAGEDLRNPGAWRVEFNLAVAREGEIAGLPEG